MSYSRATQSLNRLLEIMAVLRSPGGCPWDAEQTAASLRPYIVEEAYEVIEAIDAQDPTAICEELGDLLLQVVFQARIFEERGQFDMAAVCDGISDKLVRRHPHVFAGTNERDPETLAAQWESIKAAEKAGREPAGYLAGIPAAMPALRKARKIGEKAAKVGFDWPDLRGVEAKVREESAELAEAIASMDRTAIENELGDLLFSLVNLGRFLDIDAEDALNGTIRRFRHRFAHIETALARQGRTVAEAGPDELDGLWEQAKQAPLDE